MVTKDNFLLFKDKYKSSENCHTDETGAQYFELNLNQNLKGSNIFPIQSNSKSYNNKKIDYTLSERYEEKEKSQTWKKSSPTDLCSKYSNSLSLNHENEKCWKKNGSSNVTNNSTLSLHISAYENSNEASSDSLNKIFQKSLLIQKQKNPASKFASQSQFEFQRQQNDKVPEPEVSQFKASQQLLNLNQSDLQSNTAMDNNSDSKENCESVNNLPVHHAVDYEIKHRDVHVADWSHEIGDQDSIDSHRVPYNNSLPACSKPHQRVRTFSRGSKNPQNRNRSRNQNRQQGAQNSNSQNYEPQQRRSYVQNPQYRQSSANPQYRNRHQPPVYNTNVQPSHSATTSQTFFLLSKNSEVQRKVTIPTTSNDVRLDTKFMNDSNQTFVPRQIFAPQTDNIKPQFHQKDGKYNKQRNDQPQTSIKTVTPSTSQVFKKQVEKTFRKSFQGKMAPNQSLSKERMATKSCVSKERMASKVNQSDSKDKVVLPSTTEVNVKQDQKIPEAPKPVVKKSNPFGNARPVDTYKKMIEIEQKKLDEQNYSSNNTFVTFLNNSA